MENQNDNIGTPTLINLPGDILCQIASECGTIYFAMPRVCKAFQIINRPEYSRKIQIQLGLAVHLHPGYLEFTSRGVLHRDGGPAVVKLSQNPKLRKMQLSRVKKYHIVARNQETLRLGKGNMQWYQHGLRHRDGGPAVTYKNGYCEWYRRDKMYLGEGVPIQCDGYVEWRREGLVHRSGAPARVYANGDEEWFTNGKLHRRGGPARTTKLGGMEYYFNGYRHRGDGPARTYPDGKLEWYATDSLHRDGGPAVILADGAEIWYERGNRHCKTGPAVRHPDGSAEWWINDRLIFKYDGCWLQDEDCENYEIKEGNYHLYENRNSDATRWHDDDWDDDLVFDTEDDEYYGILEND